MTNVPVMGFWRKIKVRCQQCHRMVNNAYEVREGLVIGHFCGRNCYEWAVKEAKDGKKNPLLEEKQDSEVRRWA